MDGREANQEKINPANISSVNLVMGCPDPRAGARIVEK